MAFPFNYLPRLAQLSHIYLMKTIRFIFAAATISASTFAADITLKDGRTFKDATIVSQTPRKVTIKHAAGLGSVAKDLLPSELLAQYPIDEAAAREAERQAVLARQAAREFEKAEAERATRVRAQREATATANEAAVGRDSAREDAQYSAVEADALQRARQYFQYEYNPGNNSAATWDSNVTLSEVRPVEGWAGRWFVKGRAYMKYYQSQGRTFTSQTRDFEAYYYKDGRKTNFEVTLR
jgi:DNA-binding protein H-NS